MPNRSFDSPVRAASIPQEAPPGIEPGSFWLTARRSSITELRCRNGPKGPRAIPATTYLSAGRHPQPRRLLSYNAGLAEPGSSRPPFGDGWEVPGYIKVSCIVYSKIHLRVGVSRTPKYLPYLVVQEHQFCRGSILTWPDLFHSSNPLLLHNDCRCT